MKSNLSSFFTKESGRALLMVDHSKKSLVSSLGTDSYSASSDDDGGGGDDEEEESRTPTWVLAEEDDNDDIADEEEYGLLGEDSNKTLEVSNKGRWGDALEHSETNLGCKIQETRNGSSVVFGSNTTGSPNSTRRRLKPLCEDPGPAQVGTRSRGSKVEGIRRSQTLVSLIPMDSRSNGRLRRQGSSRRARRTGSLPDLMPLTRTASTNADGETGLVVGGPPRREISSVRQRRSLSGRRLLQRRQSKQLKEKTQRARNTALASLTDERIPDLVSLATNGTDRNQADPSYGGSVGRDFSRRRNTVLTLSSVPSPPEKRLQQATTLPALPPVVTPPPHRQRLERSRSRRAARRLSSSKIRLALADDATTTMISSRRIEVCSDHTTRTVNDRSDPNGLSGLALGRTRTYEATRAGSNSTRVAGRALNDGSDPGPSSRLAFRRARSLRTLKLIDTSDPGLGSLRHGGNLSNSSSRLTKLARNSKIERKPSVSAADHGAVLDGSNGSNRYQAGGKNATWEGKKKKRNSSTSSSGRNKLAKDTQLKLRHSLCMTLAQLDADGDRKIQQEDLKQVLQQHRRRNSKTTITRKSFHRALVSSPAPALLNEKNSSYNVCPSINDINFADPVFPQTNVMANDAAFSNHHKDEMSSRLMGKLQLSQGGGGGQAHHTTSFRGLCNKWNSETEDPSLMVGGKEEQALPSTTANKGLVDGSTFISPITIREDLAAMIRTFETDSDDDAVPTKTLPCANSKKKGLMTSSLLNKDHSSLVMNPLWAE